MIKNNDMKHFLNTFNTVDDDIVIENKIFLTTQFLYHSSTVTGAIVICDHAIHTKVAALCTAHAFNSDERDSVPDLYFKTSIYI